MKNKTKSAPFKLTHTSRTNSTVPFKQRVDPGTEQHMEDLANRSSYSNTAVQNPSANPPSPPPPPPPPVERDEWRYDPNKFGGARRGPGSYTEEGTVVYHGKDGTRYNEDGSVYQPPRPQPQSPPQDPPHPRQRRR